MQGAAAAVVAGAMLFTLLMYCIVALVWVALVLGTVFFLWLVLGCMLFGGTEE